MIHAIKCQYFVFYLKNSMLNAKFNMSVNFGIHV